MDQHHQEIPDGVQTYHSPQNAAYEKTVNGHHDGTHAPYPDQQYQYQQHPDQYQQHPDAYAAPESHYAPADTSHATQPASSSILGIKRGIFLVFLAVAILLLALVIGLGAGLGVSQRNLHNAQTDLAAFQSSVSAAATTPTTTASSSTTHGPTSTKTSSSASVSPTATSGSGCPGSNSTFYTSGNTDKQFQLFCGIDYSGKGGADDLGSVSTSNMPQCMDACATKTGCEGCGWGFLGETKDGKQDCWLKTNLTKSHNATADWAFAVLLNPAI